MGRTAGQGVNGVKIGLGKNPPGKLVAMVTVSPSGQVQVDAPEMQEHTELLSLIGQIAHAVLHVDPKSLAGGQLAQSLKLSTHTARAAVRRPD